MRIPFTVISVSGQRAAFLVLVAALSVCGCSRHESARHTPIVKVVQECIPSVVNISTESSVVLKQHPLGNEYGGAFEDFYNHFAAQPVNTMKLKGIGSGVIVSEDGFIITNAHVVNMATKVYVVLSDGTTCDATIPAASPRDDLALLKIAPPRKLKPIPLANNTIVGETVVSIGNPLGLENSVSAGIVSGVKRSFSLPNGLTYQGLVQTDASINIGSSGGALLNLDGQLVGINLAVVQGAQSIGFAIPVSRVKYLISEYDNYLKKKKMGTVPTL